MKIPTFYVNLIKNSQIDYLSNSERRHQKFLEELTKNKEEFEKIYETVISSKVTPKTSFNFYTEYSFEKLESGLYKQFLVEKIDEAVKLSDYVLAKKLVSLIKNSPTEAESKADSLVRKLLDEQRKKTLHTFGVVPLNNSFLSFHNNDSIEISSDQLKFPFTRVDLIDENELIASVGIVL